MFEDLIVEKQKVEEWKICPNCGHSKSKDIEVSPRVRTFVTLLLYMHCIECDHRWTVQV